MFLWNIKGLVNDPAWNMLNEFWSAHNLNIIAIAEPNKFGDLRQFWKSLNVCVGDSVPDFVLNLAVKDGFMK